MHSKIGLCLALFLLAAVAIDARGYVRRRGSIPYDDSSEERFATPFLNLLSQKLTSTTTLAPAITSPTTITITNTSPTTNTGITTPFTQTLSTTSTLPTGAAVPAAGGAAVPAAGGAAVPAAGGAAPTATQTTQTAAASDEAESDENIIALRDGRIRRINQGCGHKKAYEVFEDEGGLTVSEELGRQDQTALLQLQLQRARRANRRRNKLIKRNAARRRSQAARRRRQIAKKKAAQRRRRNNRLKRVRQQGANNRRLNRRRRGRANV